jgi:enamine deaminase RidA (YjgF/YER057c/UK114 family)
MKQVIGEPLVVDGRRLSLSRAVRAGDFVFLTGQIPFLDGAPMTTGTVEEQTRVVLEAIRTTLEEAGCTLSDVVKSMVWLTDRSDFPGFNAVFPTIRPRDRQS